jgi:hypothetical protein
LLEKGIIILLAYLQSQMRIINSSQWMLALLEKTVSGVFDNCPLRRALTSGKIKIPEEKYLPGSTIKAPYVFHGDRAFALTEYLMRPFPRALLQERQENDVFSYRLSRARMVVECSQNFVS